MKLLQRKTNKHWLSKFNSIKMQNKPIRTLKGKNLSRRWTVLWRPSTTQPCNSTTNPTWKNVTMLLSIKITWKWTTAGSVTAWTRARAVQDPDDLPLRNTTKYTGYPISRKTYTVQLPFQITENTPIYRTAKTFLWTTLCETTCPTSYRTIWGINRRCRSVGRCVRVYWWRRGWSIDFLI